MGVLGIEVGVVDMVEEFDDGAELLVAPAAGGVFVRGLGEVGNGLHVKLLCGRLSSGSG
jgi:hypothetical protein